MQDNVEYEAEIDAQTGVFYKGKLIEINRNGDVLL